MMGFYTRITQQEWNRKAQSLPNYFNTTGFLYSSKTSLSKKNLSSARRKAQYKPFPKQLRHNMMTILLFNMNNMKVEQCTKH